MDVMLFLGTLASLTLLVISEAEPIDFKNCEMNYVQNVFSGPRVVDGIQEPNGTASSVAVSPCPAQPCIFHRGQTANISICFTATESSKNLKAEIVGIVAGIPVHFHMPNSNGCVNSGIDCPVTEGQKYCYTNTMDVLPSYPKIRLVVRWNLTGDEGVNMFCVLFPVEIADFR